MVCGRYKQSGILLGTILLLLSGCRSGRQAGVGGERFFLPSRAALVHKYYLHYRSADGQQNWTDIRYFRYRIMPSGQLEQITYGPGLEENGRIRFAVEADGLRLLEQVVRWQGESLRAEVREPQYLSWQADSAVLSTFTSYPGGITESAERVQLQVRDSLVRDRPARVFSFFDQRKYRYADGTERLALSRTQEVYVRDMGLFSTAFKSERGTVQLELVEQMKMEDWNALVADVPSRVAYIDPEERLDVVSTFQPCEDPDRIADYYNGDPDAGLVGGKRAFQALFGERLDEGLLQGQSGYLTFRFVINCRGEAGWFITESADLDFRSKHFPESLVRHILSILQGAGPWRATVVNGQKRDAYAYVTLKLKNGKLVEILP